MLALLAPVLLVWSPKVGDKAVYDVTGSGVFGGMGAALYGKRSRIVKTVEPGRVVVVDVPEIHLKPDGRDLDVDAPLTSTESTFGPDGTLRSVKTEYSPINMLRLGRLTELALPKEPITAGGSWTAETPPDSKAENVGVSLVYTLVGEERAAGRDAYKIAAKGGEKGAGSAKVEATYWVDKLTGMRLHAHYLVTGVDAGPGEEGSPSRYEEDLLIRS